LGDTELGLPNRRRVGRGFDPSMDWIELDWVGLGGMTVTPFLISNQCCIVDDVFSKYD